MARGGKRPATRPGVATAVAVGRTLLLGVLLAVVLAACAGAQGESAADRPTARSSALTGTGTGAATDPTLAPSGTAASQPTRQPTSQPIVQAQRKGSVAAERPLAVRLPNGRTVPVDPVSSDRHGTLAVPVDIRHAGWFRGGSALGDPFGSTLLAAHVDSFTQGLGPFEELLTVRAGQVVTVTGADLRQSFRISSLRLVPQGTLEDEQWIYSPAGQRRLTLVTCAPPYVRSRGGYQNLAVVTALPVSDARPK